MKAASKRHGLTSTACRSKNGKSFMAVLNGTQEQGIANALSGTTQERIGKPDMTHGAVYEDVITIYAY
jgi:hypothetical protein